jgi:hypothetical protein
MQTTNMTPPEVGTHVFASDGDEIGKITDVGPGYFQIRKGTFFHTDIYLPLDAITGTALGGEGVMLQMTKDEVDNGDFSQPPVEGAAGADTVDRP